MLHPNWWISARGSGLLCIVQRAVINVFNVLQVDLSIVIQKPENSQILEYVTTVLLVYFHMS